MKRRFRDQTAETRKAYRVATDTGDETWVYCTARGRAMKQGDCTLDKSDGTLRCA